MLLIQLILIAAVVAVALVLLPSSKAQHQAIRRLLLLAFAGFGVLSVLFPEVWTRLARMVGVGRGTDLLLYAAVVAFLGYVATSNRRFRELETQLTVLTRRIALDEVAPPGRPGAPPVLPGGPQPRGTAPDGRDDGLPEPRPRREG